MPTPKTPPLLLLALLALCSANASVHALHSHGTLAIHLPRPMLSAIPVVTPDRLYGTTGLHCESWRLGVETNNIRDWHVVPAACEQYVGHYLLGQSYRHDSAAVVDEAIAYARGIKLSGAGKEVWVFDIDETSLSNLPYYARHGFGTLPYNATSFDEWVMEGSAPALPETLRLYRALQSLGIKIVFLTGRTEPSREVTAKNLHAAGYQSWEKLILKKNGTKGTAMEYKSKEREKIEKEGSVIVGNIGDQWSDILGRPEGLRTFKLPDPIYYIP